MIITIWFWHWQLLVLVSLFCIISSVRVYGLPLLQYPSCIQTKEYRIEITIIACFPQVYVHCDSASGEMPISLYLLQVTHTYCNSICLWRILVIMTSFHFEGGWSHIAEGTKHHSQVWTWLCCSSILFILVSFLWIVQTKLLLLILNLSFHSSFCNWRISCKAKVGT